MFKHDVNWNQNRSKTEWTSECTQEVKPVAFLMSYIIALHSLAFYKIIPVITLLKSSYKFYCRKFDLSEMRM